MIATMMEGYWGMGSTVASHGVTHQVGVGGGGRPGKGEGKKDDLLDTNLGERIEDHLEELLERTHRMVETHRLQILAVAHALETHKTVTGEDVEAIIEGRPGPLIDGRPYRSEAFAELAESYHEQVLEAHKSHAKVGVPLPDLELAPVGGSLSQNEIERSSDPEES